jgi:hypothetical protein
VPRALPRRGARVRVAIAWNAIGLRFVERDRELAPMARASASGSGGAPLLVLARRSPCSARSRSTPGGSRCIRTTWRAGRAARAERRALPCSRRLALREPIAAELGGEARSTQTWTADDDDYVLFAVSPTVADVPGRRPT